MSGIAGFVDTSFSMSEERLTGVVDRMTAQLVHRGPDDGGSAVDAPFGLALGCRRLAIQDLSKNGRQPMESVNRRYMIALDGAIYNFQELKADLQAGGMRSWRGRSDTEVLLAAVSRIGIAGALDRIDGMYAIALWDRQSKRLHLARDRLGERPLYYGWCGNAFLFASELKALVEHPAWQGAIDRQAVAAYMQAGYVPAPLSVYHGIYKLPPAHWLTLSLEAPKPGVLPVPRQYWNQRALIEHAVDTPYEGDLDAVATRLDRIFGKSLERRTIADVPVGAHLSGSVASVVIAAMIQETAETPIRTYCVGYGDRDRGIVDRASETARWLGTEHTTLEAPRDVPMHLVARLPRLFDEPYAGRDQLQAVLLAELVRERVAVILSDVGGEALFGGGARRRSALDHWRRIRDKPVRRNLAAMALRWCPFRLLNRLSPSGARDGALGDRLYAGLSKSAGETPEFLLMRYRSFWQGVDRPMTPIEPYSELQRAVSQRVSWTRKTSAAARLLNADVATTLPNDSLVALDRAGMSVGLQLRAPMLSRELMEFVLSLPAAENGGVGMAARALQRLAERYAGGGEELGGGAGEHPPLADWLRGPLADWADDLLSPARLNGDDILRAEPILTAWRQHRDGMVDRSGDLWTILMFQAWRSEWL